MAMCRPEDYPSEAWRPHQKHYCDMVRMIGLMREDVRTGLEGPCGSGKSIGYLRAAMSPGFPNCNVLSTTRQHLRQIEETLKEHFPNGPWGILRGRSWYECCNGKTADVDDPDPDEVRKAEWGSTRKCPLGDECEYLKAIERCANAQVVVQCTIGFLYRRAAWTGLEDDRDAIVSREVVILDEAHEYLGVRRSYETIELSVRSSDWNNGKLVQRILHERIAPGTSYKRGYVLLSDGPGKELIEPLMRQYTAMLEDEAVERIRPRSVHTEKQWEKWRDAYKTNLRKRLALLEAACLQDPMDPVVSLQWGRNPQGVEIVTLVAEPAYASVWEKLAPKEIFTSATLQECAGLLKIEPDWLHVFPEIFDWSRAVQPMALVDPTPDKRNNVAIDADVMLQLYESKGRPLTLALFLSKRHVQQATAKIRGKPGVLIQGADGDLSDLVDKIRREDHLLPRFLVAYSGWVGVDLPGNKWVILGSSTKSPLSAVHEARKFRRIGGGWQDIEKITADRVRLQQGLGRTLRSKNDRAVVIWTDNAAFIDAEMNTQTGRLK